MYKVAGVPTILPFEHRYWLTYQQYTESTPRGGVNRCKANLMTNDVELKTNCNTLSVTKECSRIPGEGLWTISSKFL